jgi:VCBS repeat-containing protein
MASTRQWLIALAVALAVVCGCGGGAAEQDAPINARGDTYTVEQDRTLTVPAPGVLANDASPRDLPVYAEVASSVAHGTLDARSDGGFTYTPERGFVGIDSFTYSATDSLVTSPPVTVEITVTAVSGAPTAGTDGYTIAEDTPLDVAAATGVLANDTDPQGARLTASIVTPPQHGTLTLSAAGEFKYTPAANYAGSDSFVYAASDGELATQATAHITITPVADSPTAAADMYVTIEDMPLAIPATSGPLANDADVDGDALTLVVVTQPANGSLQASANGAFTFTPAQNFSGTTSFTYSAFDGTLESAPVTVMLSVTAVNDVPVANAATVSVIEDEVLDGFVTASDVETAALTYTVTTPPQHGTLQLAAQTGGFRYVPATGYSGADSFAFTASDGVATSTPATASITVAPAPPPLIQDFSPRAGAAGRTLQIWGRNFGSSPATITIGGMTATPITSSRTYLVATIPPALAAGDHALVVTRAGGSSSSATLRILPWIEAHAPRLGRGTGTLTLTGKSFGASGSATVDGVAATVTSWSDTQVQLVLPGPLATGPHRVSVVTGGHASNAVTYLVGASDTWAPAPIPTARIQPTGVWTGNEMLIWGGTTGTQTPLGDGARYDPLVDRYQPISTTGAPSARTQHTAVWTGSEMIVWGGGTSGDPSGVTSGGRYDPLTDSWQTISGGPSVTSACAVWTGTRMLVWGGRTGLFASTAVNTGASFDPVGGAWSAMSATGAPQARWSPICVWTGQKLLVVGGISAMQTGLSTGSAYDPSTNTWTPIAPGHTSTTSYWREYGVWTGSEMITKSGRYDPALDTWTAPPAPPRARIGATRLWTGSRVIVWGGCWDQGSSGCLVDDRGEWYEPATDTWGLIDNNLSDTTAMDHTAVWTGTHMVAFGGDLFFGKASHMGIRYHAATNTWQPTLASVSTPLRFGSAVWTGTAAITFGGDPQSFLDTSSTTHTAQLDDVWRFATFGTPVARFQHTASWTGSRMIVWGGGTATGSSNLTQNTSTGGRYDPATASWQATALTGAPSPRRQHTAVWTGSQLLVFGGTNGTTSLGDGARYDPVTDTWSSMSSVGAPAPRHRHVAVWTGSEMIVWGGTNGAAFLDAGARYNPITDSWTAIASAPEISGRADPGAVWTGSQLIVWGGQDTSTTTTNTGAIYTPGGSWTVLPTSNAPAARMRPAVAWLGTKLFVWGGPATPTATSGLASGAIYDPAGPSWTPIATADAPAAGLTDTAIWTGSVVFVVSTASRDPRVYVP